MQALYRVMTRLYSEPCRAEFADEMLSVIAAGSKDVAAERLLVRMQFHLRELAGLLVGALDERFQNRPANYTGLVWRRLTMRSSFRFPKAVAPIMTLVLALVVFTIARAASTAVDATSPHLAKAGERFSLPLSVGLWLGTAYLVGAVVWMLIHALRRSGSQRLSQIETWPQH